MTKKSMPKLLTYREFPVDMGADYRISTRNALKLVFSLPLGVVRGVQVAWLMLRGHLANSDLLSALLAIYGVFVVGPVAVITLVVEGLMCAAKGRLSSVSFEERADK